MAWLYCHANGHALRNRIPQTDRGRVQSVPVFLQGEATEPMAPFNQPNTKVRLDMGRLGSAIGDGG